MVHFLSLCFLLQAVSPLDLLVSGNSVRSNRPVRCVDSLQLPCTVKGILYEKVRTIAFSEYNQVYQAMSSLNNRSYAIKIAQIEQSKTKNV